MCIRDSHYLVPWAIPIGQISMTGSIYFTMAITIERYLTVCHPFYMISRNWSSKGIAAGLIAFSVAYNVPKFLEMRTGTELCRIEGTQIQDELTLLYSSNYCELEHRARQFVHNFNNTMNTNKTTLNNDTISFYRYYIQLTELRLNSLYVQWYAVYLNFFVNGIGPFTLLIILNALILKEFLKSATDPPPQTQNHIGKRDRTLLLIYV